MAPDGHRFRTRVRVDATVPAGYMRHHVVLPPAVTTALVDAAVDRVAGTVDGVPFRRRLQVRDGEGTVWFGMSWLRDAGIEPDDPVDVTVGADPDPDAVDVPDELAELLAADARLEHAWEALTPGRRRTLVHGLERAKRPETRRRRAAAVAEELAREADTA